MITTIINSLTKDSFNFFILILYINSDCDLIPILYNSNTNFVSLLFLLLTRHVHGTVAILLLTRLIECGKISLKPW